MFSYYNPRAYVPGGSTRRVAQAIQTLGRKRPVVRPPVVTTRPFMGTHGPARPAVDPLVGRASGVVEQLFSPLFSRLGAQRAAAEANARAAYGSHATSLENALRASAAPIAGSFDTGIASAAKVNEAVANRLNNVGQTASGGLAQQLAQISADPSGAAELAKFYQGAGNAGFVKDSADLQHLIGRRAEAGSYQGKLPGIGRLTANQGLEAALSEMRGLFGEQEGDLRTAAASQASDLYRDFRTEAENAKTRKAQERANLIEVAQRERASLRALAAAATTNAEKQAYRDQEKALDRQLKWDIASLNASTRVATDNPPKPPSRTGAANQKFITVNGKVVKNPNYVPSAPAAGSETDSWITPGSAKRDRVVDGAFEALINPNNITALKSTFGKSSRGIMVDLMNTINQAMILNGVPKEAVFGKEGTALRRSIMSMLVGKTYTDSNGTLWKITEEDVRKFTGEKAKPAKATGR